MPLNIKNEKTYALARQLAEKTGQSLTRVVHDALEKEVRRLALAQKPVTQLEEIQGIIARVAARPAQDARTADEIIGYDLNGLPS